MNELERLLEEHRQFEKQAWLAACGSGKNTTAYDFKLDGIQAAVEIDRIMTNAGFKFSHLTQRKSNECVYTSEVPHLSHITMAFAPMMCFEENTCCIMIEFPDGARWVETVDNVACPVRCFKLGGDTSMKKTDGWLALYDKICDMMEEALGYNYVKIPEDHIPLKDDKGGKGTGSAEDKPDAIADDEPEATTDDDSTGESDNDEAEEEPDSVEPEPSAPKVPVIKPTAPAKESSGHKDVLDRFLDRLFKM